MQEKNNITLNEIKQAAFHEGGHLIMAYFLKYNVEKVQILLNENKSVKCGKTRYLYGNATAFFAGLDNVNDLINRYSHINSEMRKSYISLAYPRALILMGGPIAEAIYLNEDDNPTSLNIEFRGPDFVRVKLIERFLSSYDTDYKNDFLKKNMKMVAALFSREIFWNSITQFATKLINTEGLCINQKAIESILKDTEFIEYIENY